MATTDPHHTDEHSAPVTSRGGGQPALRPGADPQAEPSAEWGWHGTFPRAKAVAGWLTAFALFGMLYGNHQPHIADAWLVGLGALLVIMLISTHVRQLRARRR